ncbi:MAG: efflux RND transporter permease subunit [Chlamydiota bacterium]|nr:efflux RND transporter permease subunit [Chlamydiota bacterium]
MGDITKLAIEKKVITWTVMVLVCLAGLYTFANLPRSEDPSYIVRTGRVITRFPGASPQRVEELVTDALEEVIQEMPEIDYIKSESQPGMSVIDVYIKENYTDMQPIWDSLRRKVDRAGRSLPEGVMDPYVNDEFGETFGTILTLEGSGFSYRELKDIAEDVRRTLLFLPDVAKVDIYGIQDERIFVEYRDTQLAELGGSAVQLRDFLSNQNILSSGGAIANQSERISLEPTGNYESVEDIANTVLTFPGSGQFIYLKDIANIVRGYIDPPVHKTRFDGKRSLTLAISLRDGGNIINLGNQIKELMATLKDSYPLGIQFNILSFQPDIVDKKINDFVISLIQSVIIVLLFMLIFLGLRTGFIVSSLIPMTILLTFLCMGLINEGINQISLAALIISLGMLVDNAVVMSESIITEVKGGMKLKDAAIMTSKSLRVSLLTSSLTTASAFLPIYLADSAVGEYTSALFTVVTISLISSWVLSITMIPMLCVEYGKFNDSGKEHRLLEKVYASYRKNIRRFLRKPKFTALCFLIMFVVAIFGFKLIPNIFFPSSDRALFTAQLQLPMGTKIERTEQIAKEVGEYIKNEMMANPDKGVSGVTSWADFIGGTAPRYVQNYVPMPRRPENVLIFVNVDNWESIPQLMNKLEKHINDNYPDVRAILKKTKYGTPVNAPIEIRISGSNQQRLFQYAAEVKEKLGEIPGAKNIRDNWGEQIKKIVVDINQPRALRAGMTNQDVAISLQTKLSGFETTQYRENDEVIPVIMRSIESDRENINKLKTLQVFSQTTDKAVPLGQIADIELDWEANTIHRRNRYKTITIEADLERGVVVNNILGQLKPNVDAMKSSWPLGYFYEFGGEYESSLKAKKSIGAKLPFAVFFIVILLVFQFNSIRLPFIICMTIPLGLIGVVIGLILTGYNLDFMSFLGVISLSGIVINNAILLLDRIIYESEELKKDPHDAIVDSCVRRLRPIVVSTATTIGGLLPLWFGGGALFQSMAVTIIFGLFFATALTLGFVPVMYKLLFKIKESKHG